MVNDSINANAGRVHVVVDAATFSFEVIDDGEALHMQATTHPECLMCCNPVRTSHSHGRQHTIPRPHLHAHITTRGASVTCLGMQLPGLGL